MRLPDGRKRTHQSNRIRKRKKKIKKKSLKKKVIELNLIIMNTIYNQYNSVPKSTASPYHYSCSVGYK